MSNKKLVVALVTGLSSLQLVAEALADDMMKNEEAELHNKVDAVFDKIRAALEGKKDNTDPCCAEAPAKSPYNVLLDMLNDERYTLRGFDSIQEKTGLTQDEVTDYLSDSGIEYVFRQKRDGTELIGLEERN